ncbi:MarR family winged helix-turn-helix transcriptional regulator [Oceanicaulis sp.]|uniref:MarR family winged helix-turn-helix transcriptional regulator n=1 Tax=Oceanicaulis sp. TaxID=1924941 RepID=UPI003F704B04
MLTPVSERIERLSRLVHNEAHAEGLKPVQWEVLRFLARANPVSRSPKAVVAYLGLTKGTVSQTLLALERKGLICKSEGVGDARKVRLDLTHAGTDRLTRDPVAALEEAVCALDDKDIELLSQTLGRLFDQLILRRGGKPFGVCRTCRHFRGGQPDFCGLLNATISQEGADQICMEHELAGGQP